MNKEKIEQLLIRYIELEDYEKCSGYGLDTSDIDYEAFGKALVETFPILGIDSAKKLFADE